MSGGHITPHPAAPHHTANRTAHFRTIYSEEEKEQITRRRTAQAHIIYFCVDPPAPPSAPVEQVFNQSTHNMMHSAVRALATLLLFFATPSAATSGIPDSERLRATAAAARRRSNDIALPNDDEAARELAFENELFFLRAGEDLARKKRKRKRRKRRL
eukprot:CAMPEP_0194318098 /NCGR_PEP_ID=MMETSP0171-20130528/14736_1 /TAXON_ID=218684 /ORGANISM="Corethron pennatum, Strain L29A3" /LENGTH=157 /DNA_ID=CAMNT_0039074893 /DNA_START=73 /DNA_END=546 /DNA_ORIENTATION=+